MLKDVRQDYAHFLLFLRNWGMREFTLEASEGDENKYGRCDKLKEHHHTKKRDGKISMDEWYYDFLLDL